MEEQQEQASIPRPEFNPSMVSWTEFKRIRDNNKAMAERCDRIMRAIEADPAIDADLAMTMGIKPFIPPQMGGGQPK